MEELARFFGAEMAMNNPMYPLKFERFGEGDIAEDPEFQSHIEGLFQMGSPVSCEMLAMPNAYVSKRIYKAESKARKCYAAEDPVKGAKEALAISPHCPEAYNVMALFGAESYTEALGKIPVNFPLSRCVYEKHDKSQYFLIQLPHVVLIFTIKSVFKKCPPLSECQTQFAAKLHSCLVSRGCFHNCNLALHVVFLVKTVSLLVFVIAICPVFVPLKIFC